MALAVVDYSSTPVGPYREALVARPCSPLDVTVPWIVTDSPASDEGGRRHWGLPKHPATVEVAPGLRSARVSGAGADLRLVVARALGPAVPVAVPAGLRQPGRDRALLTVRGWARPALVEATGDLPDGASPGRGPGAVLRGTLRLGAA